MTTAAHDGCVSAVSDDVDEARQLGGELFYPHRVRILGDLRQFRLNIAAAEFGDVTIGSFAYDTEVEIVTDDLGDGYQVNIPVAGRLKTASGADRMIATPGRAAIYRADRGSVMQGWGEDACRVLAVKLKRLAVESELERLLGRAVRAPIAFELGMDVTSGRGRQCWAVIQALATQLGDPDSLSRHPKLAGPLAQSLIVALLLSATHDYSDQLASGGVPAAASTVDRAREYIEAHVADPLTAVQIAEAVGVSLRSLQHGFQVSLQTTPMRYLRDVRLRGVRTDLMSADPDLIGVAEIAYRWGFTHLGRFAEQYRRMFGDRPSHVLRSHPSASSL